MMYKLRASLFTLLFLGALGLVFLLTSSVYAAPPAGTVSYWKLDEDPVPVPPNVTYVDSIAATGNDGEDNGNIPTPAPGLVPDPTPAVPNTAQLFDGAATGIDVPADPSFDWAADDSFSIEYWVKVDSGIPAGNQVVVGRDDTPATDVHVWTGIRGGSGVPAENGRASFILRDQNDNGANLLGVGTINLADGAWHHVVAVRDDSIDKNILYVDGGTLAGGEENSVDFDYPAGVGFAATSALNLGWLDLGGGGFYFEGTLDEVALYSRALSAVEVEEHYDAGLAGEGIDTLVPDPTPPTLDGDGDDGGCFINTMTE